MKIRGSGAEPLRANFGEYLRQLQTRRHGGSLHGGQTDFDLMTDVRLECSGGCNAESGLCVKPGECRCKPGWRGRTCDQCIPFPGCLHGACEKAWQCVCEEGWGGSHCDQDTSPCSPQPCSANATCVGTGEGGYLCLCPSGYMGDHCHLRKGPCLTNGSPCQNGGTCTDGEGEAAYASCLCPAGFAGDFCEINVDSCAPDPCLNGGNCTNHGLAFACACAPGFSGFTCNDTAGPPASAPPPPSPSPSPCLGGPCASGGTCVDLLDGTFRCACPRGFLGALCSQRQHRPKTARPKPARAPPPPPPPPPDHRVLSLTPQHYTLPAHAFHKLLRPQERDLLKVGLKERAHGSSSSSSSGGGGLASSHGQLLCFSILALLTCLVILGTTAIVFFGRCETWLANARYSQLVRQHRDHLLRESGAGAQDEPENSVNIILPEKIRLASFGRHYTSI
ncbi:unnamed protein product [Merluccius merluccius]